MKEFGLPETTDLNPQPGHLSNGFQRVIITERLTLKLKRFLIYLKLLLQLKLLQYILQL